MAYVDPTQDQEENPNAQSQIVTGGAPQTTGGTSQSGGSVNQSDQPAPLPGSGGGVLSPGSASGTSPATGQGPAKPSASGSWTNLQSYLDSNTDQAAQMGNQVAGSLTSTAKDAQDALGQAKSTFDQGVSSSGADLGQEQGFIDQAVGNSTAAAADPGMSSRFAGDLSAYKGPNSLADVGDPYKTAQTKISEATQKLGLTGSEAGRMTLLQDQYGKDQQYNQGEQNLDQLLLEGNPDAQSALKGAATPWTGLSSALSDATTSAQQAAAARAASTQAVNQYAQQAISGAQGDIQTAVNSQVAQNQQKLATVQADIASGKLSPADLDLLGLKTPYLYTSDPTSLLSQYVGAPTQINAANSATPEQQAQFAALAKLSGQTNTFLPDAAQAGGYSGPYNTAGLAESVAANKSNYDAASAKALNDYNAAAAAMDAAVSNGTAQNILPYAFSKVDQLDLPSFEQRLELGGLPMQAAIANNLNWYNQSGAAANPEYSQNQGISNIGDTYPALMKELGDLVSSFGLDKPVYEDTRQPVPGPHGRQDRLG